MAETPWRRDPRKLQVSGGVEHTEAASVPFAPAATKGTFWVRSDSPNVPMFTNDAGTDFVLNESSGASAGIPGNIYEDLLFYVDSADRNSYPSTGTTVTDLMGNGTGGTLTGATFEDGAFNFTSTGSGDNIDFTKDATLDNVFATGGTIMMWVRVADDGEVSNGIVVDTSDDADAGWWVSTVGASSGHVSMRFQRNWSASAGGTWTTDLVTNPITGANDDAVHKGVWTSVAIQYDDQVDTNQPIFYINGTVVSNTQNSSASGVAQSDAGNPITIGNIGTGLDRAFDGQIAVVLMWDRTLNADEIQKAHSAFSARFGQGFRGGDGRLIGSGSFGDISGQDIWVRAGDSHSTTNSEAEGGHLYFQAGDHLGGGNAAAGRILIRSGDGGGNVSGSGDILIETGVSGLGSALTIRQGTLNTGNTPPDLTIQGADNDGTGGAGDIFVRAGANVQAGDTAGGVTVRAGDGDDNGGAAIFGGDAEFRAGDGVGRGGGSNTVRAGDGGSGNGGDMTCRAGDALAGNGRGGHLFLFAGAGSGNGSGGIGGGNVDIVSGDNNGNNITAGDVTITTGSNPATFNGLPAGYFTVSTGASTSGGAQSTAGGGNAEFTLGASAKSNVTSPGGEFVVLTGAATANSTAARSGGIRLTCNDNTGTTAGSTAGSIVLTSGSIPNTTGTPGAITLTPGTDNSTGIGDIVISYATWPQLDGTSGQVLTTDGAGTLSWATGGGGGSSGIPGSVFNGMTFYIDAGDSGSYPGTGTDWDDLINGTTGTISGVQIVEGHFNWNAATDDVNFGTVVASETENIFDGGGTIEFWIRPETDGFGAGGIVATTADDTTTEGWTLRVDDQSGTAVDLTFLAGHDTTQGLWGVSGALQVGQWYHVIVTYDDDATTNDPTFYVNAASQIIDTETTPVGTFGTDSGNTLFVGGNTGGTQGWEGDIEIGRFWDRVLSANEVQQLFQIGQDRLRPALYTPAPSTVLTNANAMPITIQGADGAGTGDGSDITGTGGEGGSTGDGGTVSFTGGLGGVTSGTGGSFAAAGGNAGAAGEAPGIASITGGSGNASAGANAQVIGGTGSGAFAGGTAEIFGGQPGSSGAGGSVNLIGRDGGSVTGNAGGVEVFTGDGIATGTTGGPFNVTLGESVSATGTAITMTAGTTTAGVGGSFLLTAPDGTTGGGGFIANTGTATSSGNGGIFEITLGSGPDDDGYFDLDPDWTGDGSHYIQLSASGTNTANVTQIFTGSRLPDGAVSGFPGSLYLRGDGTDSALYVNTTSGTSVGTDWTALNLGTSGNWSEETATTTDATANVTIATPISPVTDGTQHSVEVLILGEAGGSNTYFRRQIFTFYRDGGGAVQWTQEINGTEALRGFGAGVTASLAVSSNDVLVQATGQAATNIDWTVQYRTTNTITNGGTISTTGIVRETLDNRGAATTTGTATGGGGTVDFTLDAGAAYVTMQFLRVVTASGTCADADVEFFRDAARTDQIYAAANKDPSTQYTDRVPATMMGDDGSGLASNLMYGRITNNDAGNATFDVEAVLWGVT